jgi:hypothetical protein
MTFAFRRDTCGHGLQKLLLVYSLCKYIAPKPSMEGETS